MNIFQNMNCKVSTHKLGNTTKLTEITDITDGAAAKDYFKNLILKESQQELQNRIDKKERQEEIDKANSKVISAALRESILIKKNADLDKEGKLSIFKDIVFEVFKKSLNLDEYFINENLCNLKAVTDTFIDKEGGYRLLQNAVDKCPSNFLLNAIAACNKITMETCLRKIKQTKEDMNIDPNSLKFDLNDDENEKLDFYKSKMNVDDIADLVKQNVLTVIQDEKNREEEQDSLMNDLNSEISSVITTGATKESFNKKVLDSSPIKQTSLFEALFINSYKEILNENNVAIRSSQQQLDDDERKKKLDIDPVSADDAVEDELLQNDKILKSSEYSVDDNMDPDSDSSQYFLDHGEVHVNMDFALAEAITKYTLFEMANVLQLKKYSNNDVKIMVERLLQ